MAQRPPVWAAVLAAKVLREEGYVGGALGLTLRWRVKPHQQTSSGFTRYTGCVVHVTQGRSYTDAKLTLLHELAHVLEPGENHSTKFWQRAFKLFHKYGDARLWNYSIGRSLRYKPRTGLAGLNRFRSAELKIGKDLRMTTDLRYARSWNDPSFKEDTMATEVRDGYQRHYFDIRHDPDGWYATSNLDASITSGPFGSRADAIDAATKLNAEASVKDADHLARKAAEQRAKQQQAAPATETADAAAEAAPKARKPRQPVSEQPNTLRVQVIGQADWLPARSARINGTRPCSNCKQVVGVKQKHTSAVLVQVPGKGRRTFCPDCVTAAENLDPQASATTAPVTGEAAAQVLAEVSAQQ